MDQDSTIVQHLGRPKSVRDARSYAPGRPQVKADLETPSRPPVAEAGTTSASQPSAVPGQPPGKTAAGSRPRRAAAERPSAARIGPGKVDWRALEAKVVECLRLEHYSYLFPRFALPAFTCCAAPMALRTAFQAWEARVPAGPKARKMPLRPVVRRPVPARLPAAVFSLPPPDAFGTAGTLGDLNAKMRIAEFPRRPLEERCYTAVNSTGPSCDVRYGLPRRKMTRRCVRCFP